jgi:hypothetical protein
MADSLNKKYIKVEYKKTEEGAIKPSLGKIFLIENILKILSCFPHESP